MREINDLEAVSKASVDLKIIGQIFRKDMSEFWTFCLMKMVRVSKVICKQF